MLTYVLVWIMGLGSLGLYLAAYLFPEVHRKNDFIWGGVGLFYALVLWANAKTIPGSLLLGQIASVSLIVWLGQQTIQQRASLASPDIPRPESGSVSGRLRGIVLQAWKLIEPLIALISGFVAKVLEKPQEANIAEIEVGVTEEAKPNFLNQLTDPLSNLSGNLTGLFKSGEKSPQTVNTVTIKATPASEDTVKGKAASVVTEPASKETPQNLDPVGDAPEKAAEAEVSPPPEVETPPSTENPSEPLDVSSAQEEETSESPITVEVPMAETEATQTEATREVSQENGDEIPNATEPVDPQSALPPVEIDTDSPSHSSETIEVQPPAEQEQAAATTFDTPVSEGDTSETENSDAVGKDSTTAETSVESKTTQTAINSGDLQPEDKPEEWTAPDPLA
ncbi:hypothetical protein C1752_03246 [Acaryochloris thomasi RCC1774]|uniref:Ycf66 family protein n=1 Tax=Acaryochloris thomasi RCC1774 TaxID=1764569 RepID=A0A2W1JHD7_9CYAN|nr:Ycf66 family protein [Acaryochloris thomasi]PZD72766.1 hypothetical protein C1752_03246 [Acaryochloris thomasi RCC1774]